MVACKGDLIPFSKDALSESVSTSAKSKIKEGLPSRRPSTLGAWPRACTETESDISISMEAAAAAL